MEELKPEDLARALVGLKEWASSVPLAQPQDGLSGQLRTHLGGDAKGYPVGTLSTSCERTPTS